MKIRSHKRATLLTVALLLLLSLPCVLCFVWIRKEQRQYALNRQLIVALKKDDAKEVLALVNAGADPNTREEPTPIPTLPELVNQLLRHMPPTNDSQTALMIACQEPFYLSSPDPQLTHVLLLHGAKVNAKDGNGMTALYWATGSQNKEIITQLLVNGADPDSADVYGITPISIAEGSVHTEDIVALLYKYSKH